MIETSLVATIIPEFGRSMETSFEATKKPRHYGRGESEPPGIEIPLEGRSRMFFHQKLEAICRRRGRRRSDLVNELARRAEEANVVAPSKATVGRYFTGDALPDVTIGRWIAEYLDVSLDFLTDPNQDEPAAAVELSEAEKEVMRLVRRIGDEAAMDRLLLKPRVKPRRPPNEDHEE